MMGRGCIYGLGHGGMDPLHITPWDRDMKLDCTGFVMWALGRSRAVWYDTSRIADEARSGHASPALFASIAWGDAQPGDLLVYGDRRGTDGVIRQGHVGLVTEIAPPDAPAGPVLVIHCSAGNWKQFGDAIHESGPGIWQSKEHMVVARFLAFDPIV